MNALENLTFSQGGLTVRSAHEGDRITSVLAGTAELPIRDHLPVLLRELHSQALALNAKEVVVDLNGLEFMNSSCFKSFVGWISEVQELAASVQYRIVIRSNPKILWQRRSVHALRCFAPELIAVET